MTDDRIPPTYEGVDGEPSIEPPGEPSPEPPPPPPPPPEDADLTEEELRLFEDAYFALLDSYYADPVSTSTSGGSNQNSDYDDRQSNTAPWPSGFMEDFGFSESSREALGMNSLDYLTAGLDPEVYELENRMGLYNGRYDFPNAAQGSSFETVRNGISVVYRWHPGSPTTGDNNEIVVTGGHYTAHFSVNPYSSFEQQAAFQYAGMGVVYTTFNDLDWGDPVHAVDPDGEPLRDINGNIILKPSNISLQEIFDLGRSYRGQSLFSIGTMLTMLFSQGGRYDFQRQGGSRHPSDRILPSGFLFHREYVSFSTVAIGIFAQGAGMSFGRILSIQNNFAWFRSTFSEGTSMHPTYTSLPRSNVHNTRVGMEVGQQIAIRTIRNRMR